MKKNRTKKTNPGKPIGSPAANQRENPDPREIDALVTLFTEQRYAETAVLAQTMTARFPRHGFGWKVLAAAFRQMGRSTDALAPMQKAVALSPSDAEAHNNLGTTLKDLGRLAEAEAAYRRAVEIKPDYAEAHSNLGNTLRDLGRRDEAAATYRRVLEIRPDDALVYNNLSALLINLGRLDEAEAGYRRALEIKPDYLEVHSNLGTLLRELGRLDEAEASYRQALGIKPDYLVAHSNLGALLIDLGRLDEAESSYRRALEIKPDYIEALNTLALLLYSQGKSVMALDIIIQSLQLEETAEAKELFVYCIRALPFTHDDAMIRQSIVRALTESWGQPRQIARACAAFVKFNPEMSAGVVRANNAWPQRLPAEDLFGSEGLSRVAADPLLCALLKSMPIDDIEMERFLSMARHALLEAAGVTTALDGEMGSDLRFYSALVQQCFINEYVFSYTDAEIRKAGELRDSLMVMQERKEQIPFLWLLAVAAYFPLYSLPLATRLLDAKWPEEMMAVLVQQVGEPHHEGQLRTTIPRLTGIEDDVSLRVQNQYEENPYPRWIKAASGIKPTPLDVALRRKFPAAVFQPLGKYDHLDILIAGCGTGQHPIDTARRMLGAQVLAVDLSMASLCYAKRKAQEMGLTSIDYAQADLLEMGSIGRSFDVIESVGVLHHLADPLAGWRVLLSLLRRGGFMKIGLYSVIARRYIGRIRNFITERGYGSTASEIRRCRQDLMDMGTKGGFGSTCASADFFTISTCRDLLFHAQEHLMTLAEIDAFLRDNDLAFLGFEIEPQVIHAYKLRFPDDLSATNLGQWQIFENENPDMFIRMYQFWIQKTSDYSGNRKEQRHLL